MQGNLFSGQNLSQTDKVLDYLIRYGRINRQICQDEFNTPLVSQIVKKLMLKDVAIKKIPRTVRDEYGKKRYYIEYVLMPYTHQPDSIKKIMDTYDNAKRA